MKEFLPLYLKIVAPTHVGCDEVYEPTGFVFNEQQGSLTVFDPSYFFADLDDPDLKRFSEICRKGTISSLLEVYKFLRGKQAIGNTVSVCEGFQNHYEKTVSMDPRNEHKVKQELNKFTISRTSFLPFDNRPYIPGTAIKGAIRTAYLNLLSKKRKLDTPKGFKGRPDAKKLEQTLLDGGKFQTDPFRLLKVSDFMPVGAIKTKVVYAINEKKKVSEHQARGPYQILEVIEPGAFFKGSITLHEAEKGSGIKNPIQMDVLLKAIKDFYGSEKKHEDVILERVGVKPLSLSSNGELGILRIGRHSGAEAITIDGHRDIKIMQAKGERPKYEDHSTTIWLASEYQTAANKKALRPFGWASLDKISPEKEAEFEAAEREWESELEQRRSQPISLNNIVSSPGEPGAEKTAETDTWEGAKLSWNPSQKIVTSTFEGKRATVEGKELVPDEMHKKLFDKKKQVAANVKVEVLGPSYFKILKINKPD